jgi:hypothetical protein
MAVNMILNSSNLGAVNNIIGVATFPSNLRSGAIANGWVNLRYSGTTPFTAKICISPYDTLTTLSKIYTVTINGGDNIINLTGLETQYYQKKIYLLITPTSSPSPASSINPTAVMPTTVAYSSMPTNAWNGTMPGSSVWINGS